MPVLSSNSIYIDKMYIRKENGQSYVEYIMEKTVC